MFFTLILSDGDFDLPQDLFAALTDGCPQFRYRFQRIEIKDAQKVLMLKVIPRLHATAGHQGIGHADGGGVLKLNADIEVIILFQKTSVNDVGQFIFMVVPIFLRKLGGDLLQLVCKTIFTGDTIAALQSGGHGLLMLRSVLPQPGTAGVLPLAGVRHVKDIPHLVFAGAGINEGDPLGSPHNIPAHLLIPQVVVGAGCGVRALGVNQQLLREWIFLKLLSRRNIRFWPQKKKLHYLQSQGSTASKFINGLLKSHQSLLTSEISGAFNEITSIG